MKTTKKTTKNTTKKTMKNSHKTFAIDHRRSEIHGVHIPLPEYCATQIIMPPCPQLKTPPSFETTCAAVDRSMRMEFRGLS